MLADFHDLNEASGMKITQNIEDALLARMSAELLDVWSNVRDRLPIFGHRVHDVPRVSLKRAHQS